MSSAANLFVHAVRLYWRCSQIFELCRNFTGFIIELYVVTCCDFVLRSVQKTKTYTRRLLVFIGRPTSLCGD